MEESRNKTENTGRRPDIKFIAVLSALLLAVALSVAALIVALTRPTSSEGETVIKYEPSDQIFADLSEKYRANIVELHKTSNGYGSGFVYTFDGEDMYIVTNKHVSGDSGVGLAARFYGKTAYGSEGELEVVSYTSAYDIALLKTRAYPKNDYVDIAKENAVAPTATMGEQLLCLGNNLGFGIQAQNGIVSSPCFVKNPQKTASATDTVAVIGACMPLNSGNSGAPVFDTSGNLVGMETWRVTESASGSVWDTCYLTPAPVISAFVESVLSLKVEGAEIALPIISMTEGEYGTLYIGESGVKVTLAFDDTYLKVKAVDALGTDALKSGDIIKKFGSVEITPLNWTSVIGELFRYNRSGSGKELTIEIERDGKTVTVRISALKGVAQ